MPAVSYYLGRPARFWIAVMSGAARATVANPAAASLASVQPAAPAGRRGTPEETSTPERCVSLNPTTGLVCGQMTSRAK
jgi:hypothetical protein